MEGEKKRVQAEFKSEMPKTNVPVSKFLFASRFTDESNTPIRYFVRLVGFRAEGGLLETICRVTTSIGAKVQTVCGYALPTDLPRDFPCSMTA